MANISDTQNLQAVRDFLVQCYEAHVASMSTPKEAPDIKATPFIWPEPETIPTHFSSLMSGNDMPRCAAFGVGVALGATGGWAAMHYILDAVGKQCGAKAASWLEHRWAYVEVYKDGKYNGTWLP